MSRRPPRRGNAQRQGAGAAGYWLYGRHPVRAALENPRRRKTKLLATEAALAALGGAAAQVSSVEAVGREAIAERLPPGAVHQGAALFVHPLAAADLDELAAAPGEAHSLAVVLDRVTDPQNVGAILRSAAAFGACALIIPRRHAPPETGALAKAAAGALEVLPIVRVGNLARALDRLADLGYWRIGLAADAETALGDSAPPDRCAIVVGAEGEGLRRLTAEHCDYLVRLPISPAVESLNVSNAAAIALYVCARRKEAEEGSAPKCSRSMTA